MVVIMNQEIERIIEEQINLILNTNKVLSMTYFENIIYSNIEITIKLDVEQLKNNLRKQNRVIFINSQEEEIISKDYFFEYIEKNDIISVILNLGKQLKVKIRYSYLNKYILIFKLVLKIVFGVSILNDYL